MRYHGLLIVLGIAVSTWLTGRELARRGYDGALALGSLFFVVPLGVAGERLYHVATEYHRYTSNPFPKVLEGYEGPRDLRRGCWRLPGLAPLQVVPWHKRAHRRRRGRSESRSGTGHRSGAPTSIRSFSDSPRICRGPYTSSRRTGQHNSPTRPHSIRPSSTRRYGTCLCAGPALGGPPLLGTTESRRRLHAICEPLLCRMFPRRDPPCGPVVSDRRLRPRQPPGKWRPHPRLRPAPAPETLALIPRH